MPPVADSLGSISSQYVHVRVLLGMVVGLALTHLIRNFARIIDRPGKVRVSGVHLMWVAFVFIYLLHFWWWEFRLAGSVHWTFGIYLFVTVYALLLYMLCTVIFPESIDDYASYWDYFISRRRWFFGLLAVVFVVDIGDSWIKGPTYIQELGPEYLVRNASFFTLSLVAMTTRKRWFHVAFVVVGFTFQIFWIIQRFDIL